MEKKEKRRLLWVDSILYLIITIIGYVLLKNPELEVFKPLEYSSAIFYFIAFFAIVTHLINKRPGDYEHLIFSFSCVIIGSFILINSSSPNAPLILGHSVLLFTLINSINKGYHAMQLSKSNDVDAFPKTAICILLLLLGTLIINNLYNEVTMQTLVLGYYFMVFGILSLVEPLIVLILRKPKFYNYFKEIMEEDDYKKEKTKSVKKTEPNKVELKRPVAKKTESKKEIQNETQKEIHNQNKNYKNKKIKNNKSEKKSNIKNISAVKPVKKEEIKVTKDVKTSKSITSQKVAKKDEKIFNKKVADVVAEVVKDSAPIKKAGRPKKVTESKTKTEKITKPVVKKEEPKKEIKAGRPKKVIESKTKIEKITKPAVKKEEPKKEIKAGRPKKVVEEKTKTEKITKPATKKEEPKKAGRPKKIVETKTQIKKLDKPKKTTTK